MSESDYTLVDKLANLEEAIKRIREVSRRSPDVPFEQDLDKQQLVYLNLQYAVQDLLDMAKRLVRTKKLGWFQDNAGVFDLLEQAGMISAEQKTMMKKATSVRNLMVHRYKTIDTGAIRTIVEQHLDDIIELGQTLVRQGQAPTRNQSAPAPDNNTPKPG